MVVDLAVVPSSAARSLPRKRCYIPTLYRSRPDIGAVLHALFACHGANTRYWAANGVDAERSEVAKGF